jgi:hypothetical protein
LHWHSLIRITLLFDSHCNTITMAKPNTTYVLAPPLPTTYSANGEIGDEFTQTSQIGPGRRAGTQEVNRIPIKSLLNAALHATNQVQIESTQRSKCQ